MALAVDNRTVQDGLGRALAGAQVYYCTQPATTTSNPPSPLATAYSTISGGTPVTQPFVTDGFGQTAAYLDTAQRYTVVVWHPLFGSTPAVYVDQVVGAAAGSGSTVTAMSGTPVGTIDGTNKTFTLYYGGDPLTAIPDQMNVWLNVPLVLGVGYTVAVVSGQVKVTYATAPQPSAGGFPADSLLWQGLKIV